MIRATLALAFLAFLGTAEAQTVASRPPGVVWTRQVPYGTDDFAKLAQHGTFVWGSVISAQSVLLSRFDSSPPATLWSTDSFGELLSSDAAVEGDVCASIGRRSVGGANEYLYSLKVGDSQGLRWSYEHPVVTAGWSWVGVSRDGSRIVAWFPGNAVTPLELLVFSRDSATPIHVWPSPSGALWAMDVSDDGSRVALSYETSIAVLDLTTGATLFTYDTLFYVSNRPVALSGDGRTLAFPASGLQVYRWDGASYQHHHTQPLAGSVEHLALSRDGDTCAWGVSFFTYPIPSTEVWTQCLDVPSRTLTMTEAISSSGGQQNFCANIEVSDDGGIIAVAQAGDEPDLLAEVRVYRRDGNDPIYTLNLPGSAVDIDVSGDGRWVVATSVAPGAGPAGGRQLDLIHLGGDELEVRGVPHAGLNVQLAVYGEPGAHASVLLSGRALETPAFLGTAGVLWLPRHELRHIAVAPVSAAGTGVADFPVPASPADLGRTFYMQGLVRSSQHLTSNWVPMTIVP